MRRILPLTSYALHTEHTHTHTHTHEEYVLMVWISSLCNPSRRRLHGWKQRQMKGTNLQQKELPDASRFWLRKCLQYILAVWRLADPNKREGCGGKQKIWHVSAKNSFLTFMNDTSLGCCDAVLTYRGPKCQNAAHLLLLSASHESYK